MPEDREATSSSPSEYADCRDLIETSLATPSAIWHLDCEYSSLRCRAVADPPTVRFSTTGAKDMVSTGPRSARATCSRCLMGYPPWSRTAVNMLAEERLCKRHPGAASMQLHGCARHCRLLCQSLRALQPCATLAPSQPHSRRVMAEHV
jgi:hypothetical protein